MALTATLSELRTQVRQRADMVNSTFVSDSELNGYINKSYAELYDLLVRQYGEDYNVSSQTITTDSTNVNYALAADFYKLIGVDLLISGTIGTQSADYVTLVPYQFAERNRYSAAVVGLVQPTNNFRYKILGNNINFIKPDANRSVVIYYHPRITPLSGDSDTVDGVNGWEEYIIVDAAIKCLAKEESDTSELQLEKQILEKRITEMAAQRDTGFSERVSDVQYTGVFGMYGEDFY